ncbi:olfactory receptor 14A16-like [Sphaerodactylus townsendi]|uniref:olfactory receptor 14A16-like n=1 Tax=Sphaerodactylus townsendi TaxID=933632 RepID=UPI002026F148|nr:olfactory receptor 14A16-like [Sphaerodactylus townsendi]
MVNQTAVTEFILQGFSDMRELQVLHFMAFLVLYLTTLMGNFLIIVTVVLVHHLHTPMYFFLAVLSLVDACFISSTVPKSMANSFMNDNRISFWGCVGQLFVVVACTTAEVALLTVMAYDRYVAICHPLQYMLIMNWDSCFQMASAALVLSVINGIIQTANTFRLQFCWSSVVEQYFCDIPQLLKISCTDTKFNEIFTSVCVLTVGFFCSVFILVSYSYIFSAVFKIQSGQGKYKAFSTCIPHLTMFSLFVFTVMFTYMRPQEMLSPSVDMLAAVLYAVLPPLMNPIIYTLRNKDIQEALRKRKFLNSI